MNSSAFSPLVEPRGAFRRRQKFQFGGTPATTQASSQSQTTSDVGQGTPYPALRSGIMQKAMDMINQQYQPYDASQRFAPFNQDQLNAFQNVRNAQGMWAPYANSAFGSLNAAQAGAAGVGGAGAGAFGRAGTGPTGTGAAMPWMNAASQSWTDPGVANSWMNPFTQNVMNNTANTAMRSFMGPGGAWQGITDAFTGGGAAQFGRQRMGDVTNLALSGFGQGLGNTLGSLAQTGYNQGMQGFQNQQQLYGNLGATMGGLANNQMGAFTNLGTAQTNAAATGVSSNIAAGQAQSQLGQNVQAQNYRDLSALQNAGQTQQAQAQKLADFNYQQNREAIQFPITWLQNLQGLGQGWQLPSQTTGTSSTFSSQTPAGGSTAGNILGAGLSIAGLFQPNAQGQSAGGNILSGIGNLFGSSGSGTTYADGGRVPRAAFSAGGYAPIVRSLRKAVQTRQPAMMKRLQALQGQGAPGGGMPGGGGPPMPGPPGGAPPAAFARGGAVSDEAEDKALVRKGVSQHERAMHGGRRRTKLQLAHGGRAAFAEGDSTGSHDAANTKFYEGLARDNASPFRNFMHGVSSSVIPFGLSDELYGGLTSAFGTDKYDTGRDYYRARESVAQQDDPWHYYGGMAAGAGASLPAGYYLGSTMLPRISPLFARGNFLKNLVGDTALTLPRGFGEGEGGFGERLGHMGEGALTGAILGTGLGAGGYGLQRAFKPAYRWARRAFGGE